MKLINTILLLVVVYQLYLLSDKIQDVRSMTFITVMEDQYGPVESLDDVIGRMK